MTAHVHARMTITVPSSELFAPPVTAATVAEVEAEDAVTAAPGSVSATVVEPPRYTAAVT